MIINDKNINYIQDDLIRLLDNLFGDIEQVGNTNKYGNSTSGGQNVVLYSENIANTHIKVYNVKQQQTYDLELNGTITLTLAYASVNHDIHMRISTANNTDTNIDIKYNNEPTNLSNASIIVQGGGIMPYSGNTIVDVKWINIICRIFKYIDNVYNLNINKQFTDLLYMIQKAKLIMKYSKLINITSLTIKEVSLEHYQSALTLYYKDKANTGIWVYFTKSCIRYDMGEFNKNYKFDIMTETVELTNTDDLPIPKKVMNLFKAMGLKIIYK